MQNFIPLDLALKLRKEMTNGCTVKMQKFTRGI